MRLLVVDDRDVIRGMPRCVLERMGHEAVAVRGARIAERCAGVLVGPLL